MNVYQDVGEIFDTFVPDKFSFPITKLTGTIRLPQAVSDPNTQIRAWPILIKNQDYFGNSGKNRAFLLAYNGKIRIIQEAAIKGPLIEILLKGG